MPSGQQAHTSENLQDQSVTHGGFSTKGAPKNAVSRSLTPCRPGDWQGLDGEHAGRPIRFLPDCAEKLSTGLQMMNATFKVCELLAGERESKLTLREWCVGISIAHHASNPY